MYRLVFLVSALMFLCATTQAQELLYKKRARVIKYMQSGSKEYKMETASTDSTVLFDIGPGTNTNTKILAHFDARGYCDSQTFTENCADCFEKHLRKFTLNSSWEHMTDDHYVYSLILGMPTKELWITSRTAPYSFTIKPIRAKKKA